MSINKDKRLMCAHTSRRLAITYRPKCARIHGIFCVSIPYRQVVGIKKDLKRALNIVVAKPYSKNMDVSTEQTAYTVSSSYTIQPI